MNAPQQQIARWLINGSWIALVALLTLYFANQERDQINPNQNVTSTSGDGPAEVILKANNQHHYLANGSINGQPVTFMIDTGASDVAIPAELGQKLGLVPGERGMSTTANGTVEVFKTRISSIQLGNIIIRDIRGSLNPGMASKDDILLGMSFLKHLDFNQKNDILTLRVKE
jgi:aspartyl protease family protein